MRAQLRDGFWRQGCPVPLSDLRLLTVRHYGWDGKVTTGQLVVSKAFARPLVGVFRRLYELKFPIRHLRFADLYGPGPDATRHERLLPLPSPGCLALPGVEAAEQLVDARVRLGSRSQSSRESLRRMRHQLPRRREALHRPHAAAQGDGDARVVGAFKAIGWGWGGDWTGVKDWMHFSPTVDGALIGPSASCSTPVGCARTRSWTCRDRRSSDAACVERAVGRARQQAARRDPAHAGGGELRNRRRRRRARERLPGRRPPRQRAGCGRCP